MKTFKLLISLMLVVVTLQVTSCKKNHEITPVDEYIEILDKAADRAKQISSAAELNNVQQIISPQDAMEFAIRNADYQLTDKDKEKLKKSFDNLLKVSYEKEMEFNGASDLEKKQMESQIDILIDMANKGIDNATTLGQLTGIR